MAQERHSNDQMRKIFVGGLSRETDNASLRSFFEPWGSIDDTVVMKDPITGNSRGFGFVVFQSTEDVDHLLAAKKERGQIFTIDGRTVEVKRALPKVEGTTIASGPTKSGKIFVGGLPGSTTETDMMNYFSGFGVVSEVELLKDRVTGRLRGFGFVTFVDEDDSDKVCQVREHTINSKSCEVKKAQPRGATKPLQRRERFDDGYSSNRYDSGPPRSHHHYQDSGHHQNHNAGNQSAILGQLLQQLTGVQGFNQQHDGNRGQSSYHGDQSYHQSNPNVQQNNPLAALGLGQGALNQSMQGGLAPSGINNTNSLLLATLLGGGNLNSNALGLGNLNLLSLLANQAGPQRGGQPSYDSSEFSSSSSNAPVVHDYAQQSNSSFQQNESSGSFGYGDSSYPSQYNQSQGNYGPMKYSTGKPGGPGPSKGYKPY